MKKIYWYIIAIILCGLLTAGLDLYKKSEKEEGIFKDCKRRVVIECPRNPIDSPIPVGTCFENFGCVR